MMEEISALSNPRTVNALDEWRLLIKARFRDVVCPLQKILFPFGGEGFGEGVAGFDPNFRLPIERELDSVW